MLQTFYNLSAGYRALVQDLARSYAVLPVSKYAGTVDTSPRGFSCPLAMKTLRDHDSTTFRAHLLAIRSQIDTLLTILEDYDEIVIENRDQS